MDFGFGDKSALISRGTGHLGSEVSKQFDVEGVEIVLPDMGEDSARAGVYASVDGNIPGTAKAVERDPIDRNEVTATVGTIEDEMDGIEAMNPLPVSAGISREHRNLDSALADRENRCIDGSIPRERGGGRT